MTLALLDWSEKYSVGVPAIDSQHKKLMQLANELHDGMMKGAANDVLDGILERLISYTVSHFADEERAMQQAGYPEFGAHKVEHDKLTSEVQRFQRRFREGRIGISLELMKFLRDWLQHHISGVDMQYSPWLTKKAQPRPALR